MREGLNGEMLLREVDEVTLQYFLQWAYLKEYDINEPENRNSAILIHTKLHVLADRFNVLALKTLSFNKMKSSIEQQPTQITASALTMVVDTARYAVENLPNLKEDLVDYLLCYMAWMLPRVRELPEFTSLIQEHPDVAITLLKLTPRAAQPPWQRSTGKHGQVRRLVGECTKCYQTKRLASIVCEQCHYIQEADLNGCFAAGVDAESCSRCGLKHYMRYRCEQCLFTLS
ncbi:hypothetical protein BDZ91DRAFT_735144 [Kalaharituber pfeilii]|nr:hypothetical protein BDZ91DRAFT_735144 [Kalaharituber pfeilii]